jgi:hypothetical protein
MTTQQQSAMAVVILKKRISNLETAIAAGVIPSSIPSNPMAAALQELRAVLALVNLGRYAQCATVGACDDEPGTQKTVEA